MTKSIDETVEEDISIEDLTPELKFILKKIISIEAILIQIRDK